MYCLYWFELISFDFTFFRHSNHVNLRIDLQWTVLKFSIVILIKSNKQKEKLLVVSLLVFLERKILPDYSLISRLLPLSGIRLIYFDALVFRAFHICSSYENFHIEIVKIKGILLNNCFPRSLVDSVIRSFLNKQYSQNSKSSIDADIKHTVIFCLAFLRPFSNRIKMSVSKLFKNITLMLNLLLYLDPPKVCHLFSYLKTACLRYCARILFIVIRVVAVTLLIMVKHLEILRPDVWSTLVLTRVDVKLIILVIRPFINIICSLDHSGSLEDFKIINKNNNPLDLLIYESLLILKGPLSTPKSPLSL